jgi:hypothetical protein
MFTRRTPIAVFANPLPSGPHFAFVQKNGGNSAANANIVTSLPGATTAGNTILIFANGAGTISTPTGFTSRSPQVNNQAAYLFEKLVASGDATDTPTLVMSGAFNATWQIVEYTGITAFDLSNGNNANSQPANPLVWSTPSITPTTGKRLLVGFVVMTATSFSDTFSAGDPQSWTSSRAGNQMRSWAVPGPAMTA